MSVLYPVNRIKLRKTHPILFWIGLTALSLVLLLVVISIFAPLILKPLVEERVAQKLSGDHPGLYEVEVDEIDIGNWWKSVQANGISIEPDSAMLSALDPKEKPPRVFDGKLAELEIASDGLLDLLFKNESVVFSHAALSGLDVFVTQFRSTPQKGNNEPAIQSFELREVDLTDIELRYKRMGDTATTWFCLSRASYGGGVCWKRQGDSSVFEVNNEELALTIHETEVQVAGQLYRFSLDSLKVSTAAGLFDSHGIAAQPIHGKHEFQNFIQYQTDRIDARIHKLSVDSLDWAALLNRGDIFASAVRFGKGHLEAYRDRNVPFDESRRPSLPVRLLRELPVQINVPELVIESLDIRYLERPENDTAVAVVPFEQLHAKFSNISNLKEVYLQDSTMVIEAYTSLFGDSELSGTFTYWLSDIDGKYAIEGELSSFDMRLLNQAIKPLVGIQIESGLHEQTKIALTGNDYHSSGELVMSYTDMEVSTKPNGSLLQKSLNGVLTKNFLYHSQNPKNGDLRIGEIDKKRDPARFVFNYWWICYMDGIVSSVVR